MSKPEIRGIALLVVGQVCLFAFLQKFVYGYIPNPYDPFPVLDKIVIDYHSLLPLFLMTCVVAFAAVPARIRKAIASRCAVLTAGLASLPAGWYIMFVGSDLIGNPLGIAGLTLSTVAICLAFCVILFAWLSRIDNEAANIGARNTLLLAPLSYFIYCIVAPSNTNSSMYVFVMGLISLPLAALAYALSGNAQEAPRPAVATPVAKHQSKRGWRELPAIAVTFCVYLAITYADFLHEELPVDHIEQPAFYALLLLSIILIALSVFLSSRGAVAQRSPFLNPAWLLGLMLALAFLVIFFYSGISQRFCFDFTCALRRFVIAAFYTALLSMSLQLGTRVEITMGLFFRTVSFCTRHHADALSTGMRRNLTDHP